MFIFHYYSYSYWYNPYASTAVKVDYKQCEIWSYHSVDSDLLRGLFALVIGEETFRCSALPPSSRSSSPRGSALHRNVSKYSALVTTQHTRRLGCANATYKAHVLLHITYLKNDFGNQRRHFISQLRTQRKTMYVFMSVLWNIFSMVR